MKKLYTTNEVAKILDYHPNYVRKLTREGKIKRVNATGHPRFTDKSIRDFLNGKGEDA